MIQARKPHVKVKAVKKNYSVVQATVHLHLYCRQLHHRNTHNHVQANLRIKPQNRLKYTSHLYA